MSKTRKHSPILAASLSVVPGLGHLYLGKKLRGVVLFAVDIGIISTIFYLKLSIVSLFMFLLYLFIMIPACIETYYVAKGKDSVLTDSKPYVILLLLCRGFYGIPLLWHSKVFSKKEKIGWSITVPVLAALYIGSLIIFGPHILAYLHQHFS